MVFSKKKLFEVTLLDENNKEYKEHIPLEKNIPPYIVGEKGNAFVIKINVNPTKTSNNDVYGSKLFIDGEEVKGIKTFKKCGRYLALNVEMEFTKDSFLALLILITKRKGETET